MIRKEPKTRGEPPMLLAAGVPNCGFEYSNLPKEIALVAKRAADSVRAKIKNSTLEIGRELCAVKETLPHGQFGRWIELEFGMTMRSAQNYMSAFTQFGDKHEILAHLPITTVYLLAAPSTPAAVREKVIEETEAGARLTAKGVAKLIREAKDEDGEVRRKAAAPPKGEPALGQDEDPTPDPNDAGLRDDRQAAVHRAVELLRRELDGTAFETLLELLDRAGQLGADDIRGAMTSAPSG
ncbi:DUF3102 domain-containing protein [Alsobacter sp. KACC 23698]|uniref:DUF3102 domain-containing protein n=1 Tax=Alsobacter sp. KACC 23698 TaxID=3149229 RepID=A0AAU7JB30_9HYPH